jgi:hypothetical protein
VANQPQSQLESASEDDDKPSLDELSKGFMGLEKSSDNIELEEGDISNLKKIKEKFLSASSLEMKNI